jgi:polyhydroxyalkanoate synthase
MIKGTFLSDSDRKDIGDKTVQEKEAVVKKMVKDFEENSRKLEKIRSLLYTAGDIEVGSTPYEVMKETRAYRLAHYYPLASKLSKTPVLIVYALINKSYILDLQPDKSWIRNLLRQGFDIYLIDWKTPTNIDKFTSFDDLINCYMDDCIEIVRKKNSVDKITLHGYCMGATMCVIYTSLYQEKIRNLATIAPVIDTANDTTVIGNFCKHIDIDKMFDSVGNLPPEQLYACYSALKPFKQGVNKYFNLAENIDNDQFVQNFLRIEKWLYDTPPIAGETIRQWIKDIYQNNRLVRNEMKIGNDIIDLSKIKIPVLNIVAEEDHLVSSECSVPLNDVISSTDKRLMRFHTGHVGLIASTYSQNNVLPKVGQWLRSRSQ